MQPGAVKTIREAAALSHFIYRAASLSGKDKWVIIPHLCTISCGCNSDIILYIVIRFSLSSKNSYIFVYFFVHTRGIFRKFFRTELYARFKVGAITLTVFYHVILKFISEFCSHVIKIRILPPSSSIIPFLNYMSTVIVIFCGNKDINYNLFGR